MGNHAGVQIPPSAPVFSQCRPWGFEPARSAGRVARKSTTHGSAEAPSRAAIAGALYRRPHSRMEVRSLGYPATNSPRGKAQAGKSPLPAFGWKITLTASPSSPAPPPAAPSRRTMGSPPTGVRVGTEAGPTRCAASVRSTLLRFVPQPRAFPGFSPQPRWVRPARNRGRSPLPTRPRRKVSSHGASRQIGRRNRHTRFAGREDSPDWEGRSGFEAIYRR